MRRLQRAAAAVALLAASAMLLSSASAHEETAVYALAVIDAVEPNVPGLHVRVVQMTAPSVIVTNRTGMPVVVFGEGGEPFLRISSGRVETNLNSPTSYRAADPTGERPLPAGLDPAERPRWTVLAHRSQWAWFDPRVVHEAGKSAWDIPAALDGRRIAIRGGYEPIEGHGHFTTSLDSAPSVQGLEIRLLDGLVPALFVRNETGRLLEVPGRRGEPFLRIGPRGVFGNMRSPDFFAAGGQTVRIVPRTADPSAPPEWKRLSSEPVWSWLEYRARLPEGVHGRAALGAEQKTVLSWTTPMALAGSAEPLEIRGSVDWIPPRAVPTPSSHGRDIPSGIVALTATIAAVAVGLAAVGVRRRLFA